MYFTECWLIKHMQKVFFIEIQLLSLENHNSSHFHSLTSLLLSCSYGIEETQANANCKK